MTTEEQLLSIINNALSGGDLPLKVSFDGTEYVLIYNPINARLEKIISSKVLTQSQLDAALANYLPLTGGSITGALVAANITIGNDLTVGQDVFIENELTVNQDAYFQGSIDAVSFIGDGSLLTNLPQPDLSNYATLDGTNLFTGTFFLKNQPVNFYQVTTSNLAGQTGTAKIGFNSNGYLQLLPDQNFATGSVELDFSNLTNKVTNIYQNKPITYAGLEDLDDALNPTVVNVGDVGAPSFENSWVNFGGTHAVAGFYKIGSVVYLKGLVKLGSSTIFTLPVDFRPSESLILSIISNGSHGRLDISTSGEVISDPQNNNTWVSLSGISFMCQ